MLCPKCGTDNADQAEACVNCGEKLIDKNMQAEQTENMQTGQSVSSHEAVESDNAQPQRPPRITHVDIQPDKAKEKPVVSSGMYITIIVLSIFVPPIGIAMGFTYLRKIHPDAKKAGKVWLIWGILTFTILASLAITRS
ncbi:hypothetical protein SAMN05216302_100391 [Nitrosomonas aestuarii]|uniref:Zinc-ribbon domain-containing protein n=1 Tax=Nitrosomonas aestuarii TaxID=52441 RepID=A0A1I3Y9E3_9PROT|nr:zinc ribbon domain-containing protein [Nitrosomonas aestuarii]SFK28435.1 hypothetical protein SAMN05216302_100391 [Nitrosomonas aestuarii]